MEDLYGKQQIKQIDSLLLKTDDHSRCVYCGDTATCWDHVVPHSFITTGHERHWQHGVAPSCQECNAALSSQIFENLDDRLSWIAWRIRNKYSKLIAMPEWVEPEIKELGPNMRRHIKKQIALKLWIRSRMRYLDRGAFDLWLNLIQHDASTTVFEKQDKWP